MPNMQEVAAKKKRTKRGEIMTNNEPAVAHRILQKHGIAHTLQGHRLPLTSNDFAIGIDDYWFHNFDDVRKHVWKTAKNHEFAAVDLTAWTIADIREAVRRDADAGNP
jgi:hypothetical protein